MNYITKDLIKMADINIHNVKSIEIEKHDLDGGTWVCKISITCEIPSTKIQSNETIILFSESLKTYKNLKN